MTAPAVGRRPRRMVNTPGDNHRELARRLVARFGAAAAVIIAEGWARDQDRPDWLIVADAIDDLEA